MTDRLKFRVYDLYFKTYWEEQVVEDNIKWLLYSNDPDKKNCVIEQCTGLKDVNGNLIYENDLLKVIKVKSIPVIQCFLCEETACFSFGAEGYGNIDFSDYTLEIIGNIHENKELLND